MTEGSEATPNAYRLASGLEPLVDSVGAFEVYGHLIYNWWDRVRCMFVSPDPIVEVEGSLERAEIKLHLGGKASPSRLNDAPLTLRAFVASLRSLPAEA